MDITKLTGYKTSPDSSGRIVVRLQPGEWEALLKLKAENARLRAALEEAPVVEFLTIRETEKQILLHMQWYKGPRAEALKGESQ